MGERAPSLALVLGPGLAAGEEAADGRAGALIRERTACFQARALAQRGRAVRLIAPAKRAARAAEIAGPAVEIAALADAAPGLALAGRIARAARGAALVHLYGAAELPRGTLAALASRARVVASWVADARTPEGCPALASGAELARAAAVVLSSAAALRRLLARWPELAELRPRVIAPGLARAFPPRAARRAWQRERPLELATWGAFEDARGLCELARGFARLAPASLRWTVAGERAEGQLARALRRAAPGLAVAWTASSDPAALAALAGRSDLAVFPEGSEGSGAGAAVDEAIALGLPAWVGERHAAAARVGAAGRVLCGPAAAARASWARALFGLWARPEELAREARAAAWASVRVRRADADAIDRLERLYAELCPALAPARGAPLAAPPRSERPLRAARLSA